MSNRLDPDPSGLDMVMDYSEQRRRAYQALAEASPSPEYRRGWNAALDRVTQILHERCAVMFDPMLKRERLRETAVEASEKPKA